MKTHKLHFTATLLFAMLGTLATYAQCPINLGFEDGTFNGWTCYTGSVSANNVTGTNTINLVASAGPVANRHTMYSALPGNGLDPYGDFPVNCPNGSSHSIKLGNNIGGSQAEGVSYQFTIPANANNFSLIYYYAVVFQDPGHPIQQQPRLEIEITNVTDGTAAGCSNFAFIASSGLPGFFQSTHPNGAVPVWCKNWSANSVNLDGNAGKTIRVFFKNADCTPGGHFGYAYIDVSTECSSSFVGANYCPDDTAINVRAPYGYQNYQWFNNDYSQLLGSSQILTLSPPPAPGTVLNVELTPYAGYGCKDTLTARLIDTLTVQANAGPDQSSCQNLSVQLGVLPKEGLVYSWSPVTGLNNPNISNPIATPSVTTTYVLTVRNQGGGCLNTDTTIVNVSALDTSITLIGSANYCTNSGQSSILKVNSADSIQWYKDGLAISGATATQYNVTQAGNYYAAIFSSSGCSLNTAVKQIAIFTGPVASFTSNNLTQCFSGHQYTFTNTTTPAANFQYVWILGDGDTLTTTNASHIYKQPGTYNVKMVATGSGGCKDSAMVNVVLNPSVKAGFALNQSTQCFQNNQFIFTDTSKATSGSIQYKWDMGNGTIFTTANVSYSYPVSGTYNVIFTTSATGGCSDTINTTVTINPSAKASFTVNSALQCFNNNQFVFTNTSTASSGALQNEWRLGDGTILNTQNVSYSYSKANTYNVKLLVTAVGGCMDSTTIAVGIYPVPKADFSIPPSICTNLPLTINNKTVNNTSSNINYIWDFGNGQTSVLQRPAYTYSVAGIYTVRLIVNTTQCPTTFDSLQHSISVEAPIPGITYPDVDAIFNFGEQLHARTIGISALWTPATSLSNPNSYNPTFVGVLPQLYTVQLIATSGCITIDTQLVKTHKKIAIYVPTAFTPNNDGNNDLLRPILMSYSTVNYFRVYNRFGQLLFEMKSDMPGWDGRINGELPPTQTVVWMIEAVDVDGIVHKEQGTTLLIR